MATLTVTETHDYTSDVLVNITDITFNTSALFQFATFFAAQFDNVQISQTVHIIGDGNSDQFAVIMAAPGTFSAAGWTFTTWTDFDRVLLQGSDGADTITGSSGINLFTGGDGADTLTGGSNIDVFNYEAGSEIEAGESINGLGGSDSIQVASTATGANYDFSLALVTVENLIMAHGPGGGGSATVTLAGDQIGLGGITAIFDSTLFTNALIVTGSLVDLSPVTFTNWTSGVDTLTINGTAGLDSLIGSIQNDVIDGGGNADSMAGGAGSDTYFVDHAGDLVDESPVGSDGTDLVISSVTFSLADIIHAKGTIENLTLTGSATSGTGNGVDNVIIGSSNANSLDGGNGNDTLTGGLGKDTLTGGVDADTDIFDFNLKGESKKGALRDVITDFDGGVDEIDVSGIDARTGVAGNQKFLWIGKAAFHEKKGELHYVKLNPAGTANDKTIVSGDINGDGKADFQIELTGLHALHKGDFIL
jgi:Ca2+-binding RTX toxin-like protein